MAASTEVALTFMKENKSILLQANEHILNADHEAFLSHCTEDVVWEFVGDQTLTGKQAVREYIDATYITPPEFTVLDIIGEGEQVVATGVISLKEGNGKTVTSDYCDIWTFRDGKMAALKAFVSERKS